MTSVLDTQPVWTLDGGLASSIKKQGFDLDHPLWSARALKAHPELIFESHLAFLKAGADIILTASYQGSVEGFKKFGLYDREARETLFSSVMLAVYAREKFFEMHPTKRKKILVGGSCGPYGAVLASGAEYEPSYIDLIRNQVSSEHASSLTEYYQQKIEILLAPRKNFRCDFLAFETVPAAIEARIIAAIMKKYPAAQYWLSFSSSHECEKARAQLKQNPQIIGFGLNCVSPGEVIAWLEQVREEKFNKIVYPNSGAVYNASSKSWSTAESFDWHSWARQCHELQAKVIGGCCEVLEPDIAIISSALSCTRAQL